MIFDPIEHLMSAEQRRQQMDMHRAIEMSNIKTALGHHERRIGSIEQWQRSASKTVKRWPYIVAPVILIGLNIAPKETVELVIATLKALV